MCYVSYFFFFFPISVQEATALLKPHYHGCTATVYGGKLRIQGLCPPTRSHIHNTRKKGMEKNVGKNVQGHKIQGCGTSVKGIHSQPNSRYVDLYKYGCLLDNELPLQREPLGAALSRTPAISHSLLRSMIQYISLLQSSLLSTRPLRRCLPRRGSLDQG